MEYHIHAILVERLVFLSAGIPTNQSKEQPVFHQWPHCFRCSCCCFSGSHRISSPQLIWFVPYSFQVSFETSLEENIHCSYQASKIVFYAIFLTRFLSHCISFPIIIIFNLFFSFPLFFSLLLFLFFAFLLSVSLHLRYSLSNYSVTLLPHSSFLFHFFFSSLLAFSIFSAFLSNPYFHLFFGLVFCCIAIRILSCFLL